MDMRSNWKEPRTVESEETRQRAKEARKRHKLRTKGRKRSGRVDDDGHRLREVPAGAYFVHRPLFDGGRKLVRLYRSDRNGVMAKNAKPVNVTPEQYLTALKVRDVRLTLVAEYPDRTVWFLPESEWRQLRHAFTYELEVRKQKPKQRADMAPTAAEFNAKIERSRKSLAPKKSRKTATDLLSRVKGQKFHSFEELRSALK